MNLANQGVGTVHVKANPPTKYVKKFFHIINYINILYQQGQQAGEMPTFLAFFYLYNLC